MEALNLERYLLEGFATIITSFFFQSFFQEDDWALDLLN